MRYMVATSVMSGLLVAPAVAQTPAQDSVTGRGVVAATDGLLPFAFEISARSGPSGEAPTGGATFEFPGGSESGSVTCLGVGGNVATINIRIPGRGGTSLILTIEATDSPTGDQIRFSAGRSPGDCWPLPVGPKGLVVEGDIVVVDAQPLPTSKDQCNKD